MTRAYTFTREGAASLLALPAFRLAARLALVSAYLLGGLVKLFDWPGAVAEQAHFGLTPPALFAGLTILVELAGSALVLTRHWAWLGAGMLGIFTLLAAIIANNFWAMDGMDRFMARNAFFEHLGLIGGLFLAAALAETERKR